MGTTFLKAIVICLLSQKDSLVGSLDVSPSEVLSQSMEETPKKTRNKRKYFDTPEKQPRRSARLQKSSSPKNEKKQPSFVSGYVDGQPIYSVVRVLPRELVTRIENDIALQEQADFKRQ
jgi:hypothetical protein